MNIKIRKIVLVSTLLLIPSIFVVIIAQKNGNFYGFLPLCFIIFIGVIINEIKFVIGFEENDKYIFFNAGFWKKEFEKRNIIIDNMTIPFGDRAWIEFKINAKDYSIIVSSKNRPFLIHFVNISKCSEKQKKIFIEYINNNAN
jgi:hypothetical protein